MKIRGKLVLLVVGILALFSSAASLYFILLAPVDKMEEEKAYFSNLSYALRMQQIKLNALPFLTFVQAYDAFTQASADVDTAFEDLGKIKVLPTVNANLKNATEIIANLKTLADARMKKFDADYQALSEKEQAIFEFYNEIDLTQTYTTKFARSKQAGAMAAMESLKTFMADIRIMGTAIDSTEDTIAEQYSIIDSEIAAARSRALGTAGIAAALIIGMTLLFSILIANGIARSIVQIERNIALLKEGDLTERSRLSTKDEIGSLSRNLNLFLDGLSASILSIKEISKSNIDSKDKLIEAATEATSSTTQISANTASISNQIENLDMRITESSGSIGRIVAGIADLDTQAAGQGAMVEEATASVTEMLSSLENMSRTTEKSRASSEDLVLVAERGRAVFEAASTRIGEIPQNIGVIREMATVIQNIASQTNLLAMNAAIEAAHAGDSGRGFAVVADEIRKLSEASTTSSRDIAESIKGIVSKIDEATKANSGTQDAFAAIEERIKDVAKSMVEINSSIGEIQTGSKQILEAMVDLQEKSLSIKAGSRSMEEGSAEIKAMMADLGRISCEVTTNIGEIAHGLEDIEASIRSVGSLSEDVSSGSARLDAEVSRFKTASDESSQAG